MEFDTDWLTLGRHRIRLRSTKGFPTETMRTVTEVVRLAIDNNMSARARLVEVVCRHEQTYDVLVGTTMAEDKVYQHHGHPGHAKGGRPALWRVRADAVGEAEYGSADPLTDRSRAPTCVSSVVTDIRLGQTLDGQHRALAAVAVSEPAGHGER
uniref:Uncharacterized protein n=2 Tax=Medicago truncatula TaxID=3880 RepID=A0A0D9SGL1_MEDTR